MGEGPPVILNAVKNLPFKLLAAAAAITAVACGVRTGFTPGEKALISSPDSVMHVLTVFDPCDSAVLRAPCRDLSDGELASEEYRILCWKMLATVRSPQQDGVGLAAPQVGINRNLAVVCRVDKPGEPYEVYPNLKIVSVSGEAVIGPEGCLSIPPYRGDVPRYQSVIVSYTDVATLRRVSETVTGYAAVIFQHECDHLSGILYADKAESVRIDTLWAAEFAHYDSLGLYSRAVLP